MTDQLAQQYAAYREATLTAVTTEQRLGIQEITVQEILHAVDEIIQDETLTADMRLVAIRDRVALTVTEFSQALLAERRKNA